MKAAAVSVSSAPVPPRRQNKAAAILVEAGQLVVQVSQETSKPLPPASSKGDLIKQSATVKSAATKPQEPTIYELKHAMDVIDFLSKKKHSKKTREKFLNDLHPALATFVMFIDRISYSEKYSADGDEFVYRHVILPIDEAYEIIMKYPNKISIAETLCAVLCDGMLLSEKGWRSLGVVQSPGWDNYMQHKKEPHILLMRRIEPKKTPNEQLHDLEKELAGVSLQKSKEEKPSKR